MNKTALPATLPAALTELFNVTVPDIQADPLRAPRLAGLFGRLLPAIRLVLATPGPGGERRLSVTVATSSGLAFFVVRPSALTMLVEGALVEGELLNTTLDAQIRASTDDLMLRDLLARTLFGGEPLPVTLDFAWAPEQPAQPYALEAFYGALELVSTDIQDQRLKAALEPSEPEMIVFRF